MRTAKEKTGVAASRRSAADFLRRKWRRSSETPPRGQGPGRGGWPGGFSLIEVLIAIAIFCIVAFAVLQLLITGLGAARSLQIRHADVAVLAAELAMKTNVLEEGVDSGDFGDFYPHARWERNTEEVLSNGLFQVDFVVIETVGKNQVVSDMSILLFRPGSPTGKRFGGPAQGLGLKPLP